MPQNIFVKLGHLIELLLVLALGFGLFIYSSTQTILSANLVQTEQTYTNGDFVFILVYEILILGLIAGHLRFRKWTLQDFNLDFSIRYIGIGFILAALRFAIGLPFQKILALIGITQLDGSIEPNISLQLNLVLMLGMLVVNSIYEEVLLIGYLYKRLENFPPLFFLLFSFIVRASFHTYQGWNAMPIVFALAMVLGCYYYKYKKLWPPILAHAIGNTYYFLSL
ncbi:MAG: CPBP family intramembrane metalloprotease [Bacteroidia bacterium]|nr:CPBP family intramembrane metalloprotease [Bacteroidia bacterium]